MDPIARDSVYVWEIENFSMCALAKGEFMKSSSFRLDSMNMSEYRLLLYPQGRLQDPDSAISCAVECLRESDYEISVTVCMINNESKTEGVRQNVWLKTGEVIWFSMFRDSKEFEAKQFSAQSGDMFTIRCTVMSVYRDPLNNDDNFTSHLDNRWTMVEGLQVDTLKHDIMLPVKNCTTARTVIKVDRHVITWDLVDFHKRVVEGEWPVQTLLDMVVGRFVVSFSIMVDKDEKIHTKIDVGCVSLRLSPCLLVQCIVLVGAGDKDSKQELCRGEHRFEERDVSKGLTMRGDYRSLESLRWVALEFDFVVSHPPLLRIERQGDSKTPSHCLSLTTQLSSTSCISGTPVDGCTSHN